MKILVRTGLRHLRGSWKQSVKPAAALLALAVSASVVVSPAQKAGPDTIPGPIAHAHHWFQIGKASWYGAHFQGRRTANGERFDMNAFTCAHPTLPLNSWLRVTNLRNRRSTFVRVNDRGPYSTGAIVDLSYAAAQRLALFGKAQVRVERVNANDPELANALVAELIQSDLPLTR